MLSNRLAIRSKIILHVLLGFILMFGGASYAKATGTSNQLKAAYLYNFAKLTYWPSAATHSDKTNPLVICASASDQFTEELTGMSDKPVAGRPVQIVSLGVKADARFCDIVFVDQHHSRAWFEHNTQLNAGQLLVGEVDGFIDQGGIINFYWDGDNLHFEVSIENAERQGVQMSSRLLRLAKIAGVKK